MKKIIILILISISFSFKVYSKTKNFGPWDTKLVKTERHTLKKVYPAPSTSSWVLNRFIRIFQIYISPQDGPNCRYSPTCSQYARISINQYGIIMGMIMGADRYMRCNPFGSWGEDHPHDNHIWSEKE